MRRLLIALILMLALAACTNPGASSGPDNPDGTSAPASSAAAPGY